MGTKNANEVRNTFAKPRQQIEFDQSENMVQQQFKDEVNVNLIMKRFKQGIPVTHLSKYEQKFGDVTGIDFQNAQLLVAQTKTLFEELPGPVREKFDYDPAKFLDFAREPSNAQALIDMGFQGVTAFPADQKPATGDTGGDTPPQPADKAAENEPSGEGASSST